MSRKVRWNQGAFLLLTLLIGVLSSGADMLEDHPAPRLPGDHSESGSRRFHLVRHHAAKASPCNVCFFHKLLGQALVATQDVPADADSSTPQLPGLRIATCRAEFNAEVNRGPPRTS
jgi:hypothetical protein